MSVFAFFVCLYQRLWLRTRPLPTSEKNVCANRTATWDRTAYSFRYASVVCCIPCALRGRSAHASTTVATVHRVSMCVTNLTSGLPTSYARLANRSCAAFQQYLDPPCALHRAPATRLPADFCRNMPPCRDVQTSTMLWILRCASASFLYNAAHLHGTLVAICNVLLLVLVVLCGPPREVVL